MYEYTFGLCGPITTLRSHSTSVFFILVNIFKLTRSGFISLDDILHLQPSVQPQQNQMCHHQHHHVIQTRDLAVSRATVEGLHLLWQLGKGDVLCDATSQSSSQKKTMWLARTGEPSSRLHQSSAGRARRPAVIWSGVPMLMKSIRLIEPIPVIWKSICAQIEMQVTLWERDEGRWGEEMGEKQRKERKMEAASFTPDELRFLLG